MIDSHTHLYACQPGDAELVAAADAAGVTRMLTVGTTAATCRESLASAEAFAGVGEQVAELLDRAEITQALEAIWERVRRLNAYVAETEPWKLAKDPDRSADLDRALASLIEGLRVVAILLAPYLPETIDKLAVALGGPELGHAAAVYGARRLERVEKVAPLFPRAA